MTTNYDELQLELINLFRYAAKDNGPLDPEFKAAWVKELRGDNKQTQGNLCVKSGDGGSMEYCCLGVAAVVVDKLETRSGMGNQFQVNFPDFGAAQMYTPPGGYRGMSRELIERIWRLNDEARLPFNDIADLIEGHL